MSNHTIGELFSIYYDPRSGMHSNKLVDSDVFCGIELELEEVGGLYDHKHLLQSNLWRWIDDPSLRGSACELVTGTDGGEPIKGRDLENAIESIRYVSGKLASIDNLPSLSRRTSMHVHIDVTGLTKLQYRKLILLYIMFEQLIFDQLANGRDSSNYCVPITRTLDLVRHLKKTISSSDISSTGLQRMCRNWPKYTSLNLAPTGCIGSIEFRMFHGCFDADTIYLIVNTLLSLRKAAVDDSIQVEELPGQVSGKGYQYVVDRVFNSESARLSVESSGINRMAGARALQEILRGPITEVISTQGNKESSMYSRFMEANKEIF